MNRRIRRLSLLIGAVGALLTMLVYAASAYTALRDQTEINRRSLSEITCTGATCDTSVFVADWSLEGSDYVIDAQTKYFIATPTPTKEHPARFAPLDYSDTAFISEYRKPASYSTPDGEVWRLYSRPAKVNGKELEILIGYREKAPTMIDTTQGQIAAVDTRLEQEANKIADSLPCRNTARSARTILAADGFQIVDATTKRIEEWGPWLPMFLPKDVGMPAQGCRLYIHEGDLYLIRTDTDGRLLATSLVRVGGLLLLIGSCVLAYLITSVIAGGFSRRFLRSYFALTGTQVPTLDPPKWRGAKYRVQAWPLSRRNAGKQCRG
jgi:hypothetical protein